jgi:hypothetical protein
LQPASGPEPEIAESMTAAPLRLAWRPFADCKLARTMPSTGSMTQPRLRVVVEGPSEPNEPGEPTVQEQPRRILAWATVVAALAAAIALWAWSQGAQGRAIRALAEPERKVLFSHVVDDLRNVCVGKEGAMHDYCADQARMALEFPECDRLCKELAWTQLSRVQLPR